MTPAEREAKQRREQLLSQRVEWSGHLIHDALGHVERTGIATTALSNRSGVASSTIYNWRRGKTRQPQAATIRMVLRACGMELAIVERKR
jgi:DNA-binding phage protein